MLGNRSNSRLIQPRRFWLKRRGVLIILLLFLLVGAGLLYSQQSLIRSLLTGSKFVGGDAGLAALHLPAGFQAQTFATGFSAPRFMTFAPNGSLLVTESGSGQVVALSPSSSGQAPNRLLIASGLDHPASLDLYQGALYVGETSRVTRLTLDSNLHVTQRQVVIPNLPSGGNHITRTVLVGPDRNLYVSIGSSCNVCIETDTHRAAVWVYHLDGSGGHLYAQGLRNAVGLAINPWNQQMWATNNGRDLLGDDLPPETIYALQAGANYGWPRCHAGTLIDPDYGHPGDCQGVVQPLIKLQAHSAPLGLAFYRQGTFPPAYHGLFVAYHGSWNRSIPTGYKVVFIPLNAQGQINGPAQDFVTGWLTNASDALGRPVGVTVGPDGALYLSDDKAGMIYRITYQV